MCCTHVHTGFSKKRRPFLSIQKYFLNIFSDDREDNRKCFSNLASLMGNPVLAWKGRQVEKGAHGNVDLTLLSFPLIQIIHVYMQIYLGECLFVYVC